VHFGFGWAVMHTDRRRAMQTLRHRMRVRVPTWARYTTDVSLVIGVTPWNLKKNDAEGRRAM